MICGSSDQTTKLRASVLRLRQQVIFSKDQSFNIKSYKPSNRGKNDTAHLFLLQCFQKRQSLTLRIETGQTDRVGRGGGNSDFHKCKYWKGTSPQTGVVKGFADAVERAIWKFYEYGIIICIHNEMLFYAKFT